MASKVKTVIIDTYALIADLTGQATHQATKVLDSVRVGRTKGLIHYLVIYELTYHWRRGRLPFRNENELKEFIDTYFNIVDLSLEDAIKASKIKVIGDRILKEAKETGLKCRKLSVSDATTIALAMRYKVPIVTGDKDLTYVAERMGVKVIW